jgi:hypothetical protein
MTKKIQKNPALRRIVLISSFSVFLFSFFSMPVFAQSTTSFPNPIAYGNVSDLIEAVLDNLQGILITLAVLFIVIGGIMYITSSGDENRIKRAKAVITYACVGLAIALAGPSFLSQIQEILGETPTAGGITLKEIVTNILEFLLSILGIIAIITLVLAGGMYLTSGGMEERMKTAKKMATYAIIGITIALASLIIVKQIASLLEI